MSFVKSKLRLARDALDKKNYIKAKEEVSEVLDYESSNYHAHVFFGLASLELGEYSESEQVHKVLKIIERDSPIHKAYRKAIEIQRSQTLAWQGLSRLLERTEQWSACVKSLYELANIQCSQDDAVKCGETMQKIIDVCRRYCDRQELTDALCHLLPGSRFYDLLSTLPEPDNSSTVTIQRAIYDSLPVLEEIVSLIESNETEVINREIQKRRTRLGAPNLDQLQKLVGQEVWSSSRLPEIYTEITSHPGATDVLRRDTESKLLRYKYRYLCSLPSDKASLEVKERTLRDVNELVGSAILLKIPDELAWNLSLEHQNSESIATCDSELLHDFVELFPNNPVAKLLNHFFSYMKLRLLDVNKKHGLEELGKEECFNVMLDAHSEVLDHILANRILAEVYLEELDHESAIKVADRTLVLLKRREADTGITLHKTRTGTKAIKATGLVHLYPPKHHGLASVIIEDVLSFNPNNTPCLLGKAFVLQASERWEEARTYFLRVASLISEDDFNRLRSVEEAAWCQFQGGQQEEGLSSLQHALALLNDLPCREADRARCLWRIGQCQGSAATGDRQESYRCFIASLKQDPSYAPAYTSLGIYYSENVPPDSVRASRCFQKAFELDSREAEAARRLAQGFAEDRDWDLVEVVAHRTIEGEGGLSGGLPFQSSDPDSSRPTNSWAWKAIGIVELSHGKYAEAVKALQTALITNANDGSLWLRLGEAHSKAGRHAAALKAFHKAKELEPDEWLCHYFISEVKRQMGEFQDAIVICTDILSEHPGESAVQISLMQSHFDLGRLEQSGGFQERAEQSFLMAIKLAFEIVQGDPGARAAIGLKLIADTLFYLSRQGKYSDDIAVRNTLREVIHEFSLNREDDLTTFVPLPYIIEGSHVSWKQVLAGALMVYRYRFSMASPGTVSSSHWYDLGVGLQVWASKTGIVSEEVAAKITSYLRQALQESPRDASTWAALGTFYFLKHAKLAQHAYVMSLEIDPKNVANWNNLGFLYLHHGDYKLASESFTRAQTLDPDNAISWIGQALLRHITGLESEAREILAHAITLGPIEPEACLRFAYSTFQKHLNSPDPLTASHHLISAFFTLHSYCSRTPEDAFAYHLFGLVNESLEKLELGEGLVRKSTGLLEAEYEDTEDPAIERQFALANSSLARLRLARQDLTGATDSFQNVLGLLAGDDDAFTVKLRVHAQLGLGLAKFLSMEIDSALESCQTALDHAREDLLLRSHATILLSQIMWTTCSENFREIAKSQLLQCIAADSMDLTAVKTLTAMGILSNDENLIDAALSELLDMPAEQRRELDPSNDIDYLLIYYNFSKGDVKKALAFAQRALHEAPSNVNYRIGLATMMIEYGAPQNVLALLSGHHDIPQDPQLLSERLCLLGVAYALSDSVDGIRLGLRCAQKAIMAVPWSKRPWQALGFVRSQAALCQQSISMQV